METVVGLTLKRFYIQHLPERTEIFEASPVGKGFLLVFWVLLLVVGVQEYDYALAHDENLWRGRQGLEKRLISKVGKLDFRESKRLEGEGASGVDGACAILFDVVHKWKTVSLWRRENDSE